MNNLLKPWVCPSCGHQNQQSFKHCIGCGTKSVVGAENVATSLSSRRLKPRFIVLGVVTVLCVAAGMVFLFSKSMTKKTDLDICGGFNRCYRERYAKSLNASMSLHNITISTEDEESLTMRVRSSDIRTSVLVKGSSEELIKLARLGFFKRVKIEGYDGGGSSFEIDWPSNADPATMR